MSIEDSETCMKGIINILYEELDIDLIILSGLIEREYTKNQAITITKLAELYEKIKDSHTNPLIPAGQECDRCVEKRRRTLEEIENTLPKNPRYSYYELLKYTRQERRKAELSNTEECLECRIYHVEFLEDILKIYENNNFLRKVKRYQRKFNDPQNRKIYKKFLHPLVKPYFSTSRILLEPPEDSILISTYKVKDTLVRLFLPNNKPEHIYFVSPAEYSLTSKDLEIIHSAREKMLKHTPKSIDFSNPTKTREYFFKLARREIAKIAKKDINFTQNKIEELSEIITKYTAGMGILETLLSDPYVQDVYVNAPASKTPVCLNHSQVEDCVTNIFLTENDTKSLISRFRARSGRAFSEANPILEIELPELGTRVATIGRPLSPDGLAFALRRQKTTPWTLPQFIANKTINSEAAGLLSFLIDGQVTLLVTGSRGSGKTSLLVSLLSELTPNSRVLTIEDTLEIPASTLNAAGFRIQRLKIQSTTGKSETEITPQEALSTALRLGESVLVIGEVRGPETRILYESMRIGAAGNAVMGTIHGASSQSVFERVVYDMGIPASSFKSTDIVMTAAPIRIGGGLKRYRRVLQISEVNKDWYSSNPDPKEVFSDLMVYNPSNDRLEFTEHFYDSRVITSIAKKWNIGMEEALKNIELRSKIKRFMVDISAEKQFKDILEVEHVVNANNMLRMLNEEQITLETRDYDLLFQKWTEWFLDYIEEIRNVV